MSTTQPTPFRRHRRRVAGAVAAVAVAGLLAACGSSSSTQTATVGNAAATTPNASATGRQSVPPGLGKTVTGAAADKAKAAALAKYPGTVERGMQLPDGSYEVHVITTSGSEVHVQVSKAFAVTGTQQGGPPAGATPPAGNGTTTTQNS